MKQYKIDDLIVAVPKELRPPGDKPGTVFECSPAVSGQFDADVQWCGFYISRCHWYISDYCPRPISACHGSRPPGCRCSELIDVPVDILAAGELAVLKVELTARLAQVNEREAALATEMQPQTIAEVEDLEVRLQGALKALGKQKLALGKAK